MNVENAKKEFENRLVSSGQGIPAAKPALGIPEMLSFYRDVRADDADMADGGDMLLFQWGTYDWGSGEMFELDITRQLIPKEAADDDEIWQLGLTYSFAPDDKLRALQDGNRWASGVTELQEFEAFVVSHPAFEAVKDRTDGHVVVDFEIAG
jgi:hypothetical protein